MAKKTKDVEVPIRLRQDWIDQCKAIAEQKGLPSYSDIIRMAIKKYLDSFEWEEYFVFIKYHSDDEWLYCGSCDTKEEAEKHLEQTGEPEDMEHLVIKGRELRTEEGIATYPYDIIDEGESEYI